MSDNKSYFEQQSGVASQKYMNADGDSKKESTWGNLFASDMSKLFLAVVVIGGLYFIFKKKIKLENVSANKKLLEGLTIGGVLLTIYLVYKAIGDYQTYKRVQNIDRNIAKLSGGQSYDNALLDKITLSKQTEKLEQKFNNKQQ